MLYKPTKANMIFDKESNYKGCKIALGISLTKKPEKNTPKKPQNPTHKQKKTQNPKPAMAGLILHNLLQVVVHVHKLMLQAGLSISTSLYPHSET